MSKTRQIEFDGTKAFVFAALSLGLLGAAFAGGFRLGQEVPVELAGEFVPQVTGSAEHRERIEAPRQQRPDETEAFQRTAPAHAPRVDDEPAAAPAAQPPTVAPEPAAAPAAPVAAPTPPADAPVGVAPSDTHGGQGQPRVLERAPRPEAAPPAAQAPTEPAPSADPGAVQRTLIVAEPPSSL